jgi:Na+/melibiose symporter-like transporter
MFISSFIFYPFIYKLAAKIGKKRLLTGAFIIQSAVFFLIAVSGIIPAVPARLTGFTGIGLVAAAVAVFGIVPPAVNADLARMDSIKTGNHKEGIFSGIYSFTNKAAIAVSNLIFPSLLLLGKSAQNTLGVRLTAAAGGIMMIAGMIFLKGYDESRVNSILARENAD